MHFGSKKHHGITLPGALRMPEYAELFFGPLRIINGVKYPIHPKILVVLCQHLYLPACGIIKEDKILKDVHEVLFIAHAFEQGFHINHAGV